MLEELARTWVGRQGMLGQLPFTPELIGSHWGRTVQADVVAINWRERVLLVGECKWGTDPIGRQVLRQLVDHTIPQTVAALPNQGAGWRAIPALFARAGATPDALALLQQQGGILVDLIRLYADLAEPEADHA